MKLTPECNLTYRVLRVAMALFVIVLVLAMFPYTARPAEDLKVVLYQIAGSLFLIVILSHFMLTRRAFERPPVFFAVLVALLALYVVSALASDYVGHSLVAVSRWASLVTLYFVASQIYPSARTIRPLLIVFCIAVALSSLYAFVQKLGLDPFPWQEELKRQAVYRDLPGTFGNPSIAGYTLILALILSLYLATLRDTRWCILLALTIAGHIWFTNQRSGLLALGVAAVLATTAVGVRRMTRKPALAVVLVVLLIAVMGAVIIATGAVVANQFTGHYAPVDDSIRLRCNAFQSAIAMIHEKPVLGYGPGNYKIANVPFWTRFEQEWFAEQRLMNYNVHNDLLEAAVDAGLLGGLLYTAFLALAVGAGIYLYVARDDILERRLGLALAAVFTAFTVDGFFGFNVRVPVSAGLIFILAGALDGWFFKSHLSTAPVHKHDRVVFWPVMIGVAAAGNMVFAGAVFLSEYYYQVGQGAHEWKVYPAAEAAYRQGQQLAPWNWLFPYRLGINSTAQGKLEEAKEHFQRSLDVNPFYIPAQSHLAQNSFDRGAPALLTRGAPASAVAESNRVLDRAIAHSEETLALCATWPEAEDILGRVAFVRGAWLHTSPDVATNTYGTPEELWEKAAEHLRRAIAFGLAQPQEPLRLLAQIYLFLREPMESERYLFKALAADVHSEPVWPTFWEYARTTGAYPQLLTALEQSAKRATAQDSAVGADTLANIYLWMARVHHEGLKDREAAADAFCRAAHEAFMMPEVWNSYAQFALTTGNQIHLEQCLSKVEAYAQSQDLGLLPQVQAVATALAGGAENVARGAAILADLAERTEASELRAHGIPWAAPLVLAEVREQDQTDEHTGHAYAFLADVFESLGRPDLAKDLLQNALAILHAPEQSAVASRLAAVLQRMEQPQEAVRVLREAMVHDSMNGHLHLQYARALAQAGRTAEARLEYQNLLKMYTLPPPTLRQVEQEIEVLAAGSNPR